MISISILMSISCYRFRRELKRLEEEGRKLIEEELERVNKAVEEELRSRNGAPGGKCEAGMNLTNKGPGIYLISIGMVCDLQVVCTVHKELHSISQCMTLCLTLLLIIYMAYR